MAEFRDVRGKDQFQHKDRILAAQKQWEQYSDTEKALFQGIVSYCS